MKFWPRKKHRTQPEGPRADIQSAEAELARIKAQRPDVETLVAALIVERHLNNFSANLTATFRGGRS